MVEATKGNHGAYPLAHSQGAAWQDGMTIREYFAVRIMEGLLAHHGCGYDIAPRSDLRPDDDSEYMRDRRQFVAAHRLAHETTLARKAVSLTDALLLALQEETAAN